MSRLAAFVGLWTLLSGSMGAMAGFMPPQAQILSDMQLANSYFTNEWPVPGCSSCLPGPHPSCIWTRGTYIEGDLALYRINHDPAIYDYAVQWGAFTNWNLRYGDTDTQPDSQCAAQSYVELYLFDTTQTNRLTHVVSNADFWVSGATVARWTYVDAIHMSMPMFAKLVPVTGNTNYSPKMYSWFNYTKSIIGPSNGIYNVTDHLWWRDTTFLTNYTASDGTKQKCYWSRGNGWAFVALTRVMDVLPANDVHFAEYRQTFQEMAAALQAVQRADGFWDVNLGYTNDYPGPETTGTACFTCGLAWGINQGYLDANTYLPAVINGWNALANGALHHSAGADNGFLGYVQGTGSKPADHQPVTYNSVPDFDDFGLGLFLLAGSQVYQLSSASGITLAMPVLTNHRVQLGFTVISTLTNATFNLLETSQLGTGWTTNTTATLTTNTAGISYRFAATNSETTKFYRVQISP